MSNRFFRKIQYKIRAGIESSIFARKQESLRKKILDYYRNHPPEDAEIRQAVDYLSQHRLSIFYGNFQQKYDAAAIEVFTDAATGLPYVTVEGKRLFFKRSYNRQTVRLMFNGLRIEQDSQAPHCYTDEKFGIEPNEVLADIGCAEAYFSLLNIEKLKKVYLFEQDSGWIEALEATFDRWRDKVEIVPRYVSDRNNEREVRLDDFFRNKSPLPDFCKIDVEGAEKRTLEGMEKLLKTKRPLKIALCTYHRAEDFARFSQFFRENGFEHRANPGVMIFQNDIDTLQPPYFRKCLIKAEKK